jgi:hypothetical protein
MSAAGRALMRRRAEQAAEVQQARDEQLIEATATRPRIDTSHACLVYVEFDDAMLRWTFDVEDARLPRRVYVHVSTCRAGRPLESIFHSFTDGLTWTDRGDEDAIVGLPTEVPLLHDVLAQEIENRLLIVDLVRLLERPMVRSA